MFLVRSGTSVLVNRVPQVGLVDRPDGVDVDAVNLEDAAVLRVLEVDVLEGACRSAGR